MTLPRGIFAEVADNVYITRSVIVPDAELYGSVGVIDTYVGENASLHDKAHLEGCTVTRQASVYGEAWLANSYLGGMVSVSGGAYVLGSVLGGCVKLTDNSIVYNSHLEGMVRVGDEAVVDECYLGGGIRVCGTARVFRLETDSFHRFHEGDWNREPVYIRGKVGLDIHECVNGKWIIGCKCLPIQEWLDKGPRLATALGMSEEEADWYYQTLKSLK
jgi:carbonic anhydrase/acetyltransferase-like protein (isoleucine patch superfamily)